MNNRGRVGPNVPFDQCAAEAAQPDALDSGINWIHSAAGFIKPAHAQPSSTPLCTSTPNSALPALNPARHPASPLLSDAVREAPALSPPPGSRVGAPNRCIPLFASIIECAGRTPGYLCMSVPVDGFFGRCVLGHTQLPTASDIVRRFMRGCQRRM